MDSNGSNGKHPLHLRPSERSYRKLNELADLIAKAVNPHMVHAVQMDVLDPERQALINILKDEMNDWISVGGAFAHYLCEEAGD